MKRILLLLLIGITPTSQYCGEGCLKCGEEDACLLCNFNHAYVLENGSCTRQVDTKCLIAGFQGNCYLCNAGYYLDINSRSCILVDTKVSNCKHYLSNSLCSECNQGYYETQGVCVTIVNKIENCDVYYDFNKCQICKAPYSLSSDWKSCTKDSNINNCYLQSNFQCLQCLDGYYKNQNYYEYALFDQNVLIDGSVDFLVALYFRREISSFPDPCEKITVTNCLEPTSAVTCSKCANGYFLTEDNVCQLNPYDEILHCEVYENYNRCSRCEEGYYLNSNSSLCKAHTSMVLNCQEHSQYSDAVCVNCAEGYYLQSNKCHVRQYSLNIKGCSQVNYNSDTCDWCEDNYVIRVDGLLCLEKIENCLSYNSNQNTDTQLTCLLCENNNYLDTINNVCLQGSIENCDQYSNPAKCQKCKNGFYLNAIENKCEEHNSIAACLNYSNDKANVCEECIEEHYLFTVNNYCSQAQLISHCITYSGLQTCSECEEGFYLSNGQCNEIVPAEHCLRKNNNDCIKCEGGYFLNIERICQQFYDYQVERCNQQIDYSDASSAHEDKLDCYKCDKLNFLKDFSNRFVCISDQRIQEISDIQYSNNCQRFQVVQNSTYCLKCQDGYFLQQISTQSGQIITQCKTTCINDLYPVYLTFQSGSSFDLRTDMLYENFCYISGTAGTKKVYTTYPINNTSYNFGQCPSNNIVLFQNDDIGITNFDLETNEFSYAYSYPAYDECHPQNTFTNIYPDPNDSQYHCQSYTQKNPTDVFCVTCKFGYTGAVKDVGGNTYVECNREITGCSSDFYGGFIHNRKSADAHTYYSDLIYSCHKCSGNYIPFLHLSFFNYQAINFDDFQPFSVDQEINPEVVNGSDSQIKCLIPEGPSFNMGSDKFTKTFPANCGLGLFNTSYPKSYTDLVQTIYCMECAPGYRKVVDQSTNITSSCEIIPNCEIREDNEHFWFNSCAQCMVGYTWPWDSNNQLPQYDQCVENTINNCAVVNGLGNSQNCVYCNKGFDLIDGQCEQFYAPLCDNYQDIIKEFHNRTVDSYVYSTFWLAMYMSYKNQKGCDKCYGGYISVMNPKGSNYSCTSSYQAQYNSDSSVGSLIPHCIFYSGLDNSCLQCNYQYILKDGGDSCVERSVYPYCTQVNSLNNCIDCEIGYYVMDGACLLGQINNCTEYYIQNNEQLCNQCESGYRPSIDNRSCQIGYLGDCDIYDNEVYSSCLSCTDNKLTPVYSINNIYSPGYCFYPITDQNCQEVQTPSNGNKVQEYQCGVCKSGFYMTNNHDLFKDQTMCVPIRHIEHCLTYDLENSYFNSSFKCTQCEDQYYVSVYGYQCKKRTKMISNCNIYNPLFQLCSVCETGFYLNVDNTACMPNPTGILNCYIYIDLLTCKQCDYGYYLSENKCKLVETVNLVSSCIAYDSEQKCTECNSNFQVKDNQCVTVTATNCLTSKAINQCETCPDSYYLVSSGETIDADINCVYKNINHCEKLDQETGFCNHCSQGYYINSNGWCSNADYIEHCLIYESKTTCQQCEQTYYVSREKTSCEIKGLNVQWNMDTCLNLRYKEEKNCSICEGGHYFDEHDNCVTCEAGDGCFLCDAREPTVCLLCMDGFYQKEYKGYCYPNEIEALPNIFDLDNGMTIWYFLGISSMLLF